YQPPDDAVLQARDGPTRGGVGVIARLVAAFRPGGGRSGNDEVVTAVEAALDSPLAAVVFEVVTAGVSAPPGLSRSLRNSAEMALNVPARATSAGYKTAVSAATLVGGQPRPHTRGGSALVALFAISGISRMVLPVDTVVPASPAALARDCDTVAGVWSVVVVVAAVVPTAAVSPRHAVVRPCGLSWPGVRQRAFLPRVDRRGCAPLHVLRPLRGCGGLLCAAQSRGVHLSLISASSAAQVDPFSCLTLAVVEENLGGGFGCPGL
ncbi:MAG: hypothetical protein BJ554DRAFT_1697, partial [Olpidium bornovanus]